jgi:CRISPR/Cas system-associated exonuclease Cas4 (RecB family)
MTPFLYRLSAELLEKYGKDISRICIVFPSRRAGLYFRKYLSRDISGPIWMPAVLGIEDFITKYSPYNIADKMTLIFELFEVYRQYGEDESFDRFYPWGEMLLNDFDEIDKNLAAPDYLFRILKEQRQIELDFELKIGDIEEFHRFWETFSKKELTTLQTEFINTWEIIGKVYHAFRKALLTENLGYEGMAYRRIHEMVISGELKPDYDQIIFAGFNLLNNCEKGIMKELIKQGKAGMYWDADNYYMDDSSQEAGLFLRKNFAEFGPGKQNEKWITNGLSSEPKNIRTIGSPLHISQIKILGNELKKLTGDELNRTAVVLPDESLLVPLLYSLPDEIGPVNVTMGFPFKNSPLYGLIQLLRGLQRNKKGSGESTAYYHKDVTGILLHPYINTGSPFDNMKLAKSIKKKNSIYVSQKRIEESYNKVPELISVIFSGVSSAKDSMAYISKVIQLISGEFENSRKGFDMEFLYKCYTELKHLSEVILRYSTEVEPDMFWKLLIEVLNSVRIPFTGEPLKGLQIMGLLETRLLDFDNVFILSLNEGIIPGGNTQSSFIPYRLRKAFKIPCYEEEDANTAYNFFRLLQRAVNICLIYNTEPGELAGGEKSRFIMQIENELALRNSNIVIEDRLLQSETDIPKQKEITVVKSAAIIESLKKEERFSASDMISYIHCPLQFYFRKVARLREDKNVEEYFSGGGFGTLLHQVMDILYRDRKGSIIDKAVIISLKKELKNGYEKLWIQACEELPEYEEFKTGLSGKNLLFKNIIKKLVGNILDNDLLGTPFRIDDIESKLQKEFTIYPDGNAVKINLFGRLDRVEEKNGITRIIDYKTGKIEKLSYTAKVSIEEHIRKIFGDSAFKENFQQLFYASLYMDVKGAEDLVIGLYPLREPSAGIYWFENEPISKDKKAIFENELTELLNRIFDSTTPFTQTKDPEKCKYCPYKSICYRD